jgi:hypothetical protein
MAFEDERTRGKPGDREKVESFPQRAEFREDCHGAANQEEWSIGGFESAKHGKLHNDETLK